MEYAFIINLMSGKGKAANSVLGEVERLEATSDKKIRHYMTDGTSDATVLADQLAKEAADRGEEIYVYACGGDGTINEVANGLLGHKNASLGVVPVGSGNDFVRNFGTKADFLDIERQLEAKPQEIDVIEFEYELNGEKVKRLYVNGMNIGFDGNTAILAHNLKAIPGISGTFSYVLAAAGKLAKKEGEDLKVYVDGELFHDGPLLLCTVANGRFCGGGFESCPKAKLDDGLAEVLIVDDMSRRRFIQLVPKYKKGQIFEIEGVEKITKYMQATEIKVIPNRGKMNFVADGEIFESGEIEIELLAKSFTVLVP